jgi:hypothetical protein
MRSPTLLLAAALLVMTASACVEATPVIESTTVLQSTPDTVGPYEVHAVVRGVTDHVVELRYRLDSQVRFVPLVMEADPGGERFRAAIPGSTAGTLVSYYVAVLAGGARVAADPEAAGAGPYTFLILAD